MGNLADQIERFILRKLAGDHAIIVLRRNELADELECAPSQISYVLNTRFTIARGFIVESRRGSGGFIRIAKIPIQSIVYEDAASQVTGETTVAELEQVVARLREHGLLTPREQALLNHFFTILYQNVEPQKRPQIIASIFALLSDFA